MTEISLDCPHCRASNASFLLFSTHKVSGSDRWTTLMICRVCQGGAIGEFTGHQHDLWIDNWQQPVDDYEKKPMMVWPSLAPVQAPEHLPLNIQGFYLQGMDNFHRRQFDAAGPMFRRCLDVSLKVLDPEGKGSLYNRIDKLPEKIGVSIAMKEWAHQIRDLGNETAHEEEPATKEEAVALQGFTEMFLIYAFTMPVRVAERRVAKIQELL